MMRELLLGALMLGCKGKPSTVSSRPTPEPALHAERDAMWALAPRGAVFGAVITPAGLADLEAATVAIKRFVDGAPELAAIRPSVDQVASVLGAKPSLAAIGMSATKGLAYFSSKELGELLVLPVVDRGKFLAAMKGTPGTDGDRVGGRTCNVVRGRYACAKSNKELAALGTGGDLVERLRLVGQRGELELAVSVPLEKRVDIAAVIQTERGGFVLHAAARGIPAEYLDKLGSAKPPHVDDRATVGFGVVDLRPLLPPFPSLDVVRGAPLDALVHSIAGPITFRVSGDEPPVWDVRLPLSDPALAKRVVEHCDQIPKLATSGATVKSGVCTFHVPKFKLTLDAWIENAELRLGSKGAKPRARASEPTGLAKQLGSVEWSLALYGRGTMYAIDASELADPKFALPARGISVLTETGMGARVDGETLRVVFGARTIWANPDHVVDQIVKLAPGRDPGGAKALADRFPESPFASDLRAGWGGIVVPSFVIGIYSAIGVPAFIQYMERSKP
jgi:hypothetical protein